MLRGRFYCIGKQRQTCCTLYGIDCTPRVRQKPAIQESEHGPGTTKLSSFASSGMGALGSTNAPVEISMMFGVDGEEGFAVSTTFAKCVGTDTFGGEPITSCVCMHAQYEVTPRTRNERARRDIPRAIYHPVPVLADIEAR